MNFAVKCSEKDLEVDGDKEKHDQNIFNTKKLKLEKERIKIDIRKSWVLACINFLLLHNTLLIRWYVFPPNKLADQNIHLWCFYSKDST
jgi:di/tricarboxylate transporter